MPSSTTQTYRPHDFKEFPPSRFRIEYIFHDDRDCDWFYLAPNDAHHFRTGTWQHDPQNNGQLHVVQDGETKIFRIEEQSAEILRMTPLN